MEVINGTNNMKLTCKYGRTNFNYTNIKPSQTNRYNTFFKK